MRSRKGFVQIEMYDIDAHIARARDSDERIHVCAIHVNQPTSVMHNTADLLDVSFKEPQRIWVG